MARGDAHAAAMTDASPVVTIVATHVMTDEMHVVTGTDAEVFVELRARFPTLSSSPDLAALLAAIGRTHFVARLPGRVAVPSTPVSGPRSPGLRLAKRSDRE